MRDSSGIYRALLDFSDAQGVTVSCAAYCMGMISAFERPNSGAEFPPGYLGESYLRGRSDGLRALVGNGKPVAIVD